MGKIVNRHFVLYLVLGLALVLVLFIYVPGLLSYHYIPEVDKLTFEGTYSVDNGDECPLNADEISSKKAKRVVLRGRMVGMIGKVKQIHFKIRNVRIVINQHDEKVFDNGNNEEFQSIPFSRKWDSFEMPCSHADNFCVIIEGDEADKAATYFMDSLCVGESNGLLRAELVNHLIQIIVGILIFCIGFALSVTVLTMLCMKIKLEKRYFFCSMILICGALCTLLDYNYIIFFISNERFLNTMDYLLQLSICIFLLFYLGVFFSSKKLKKIVQSLAILMCVSVVVGLLADYCGIVYLMTFVAVQIPICLVVIVLIFILLLIDYYRSRNSSIVRLIQSGILLGTFAMVEMVHYIESGEYWIVVFQFGLLIFAIMQFGIIMRDCAEKINLYQLREKQLMENRISIMMSQIQPHFLYNTLTTIADLCGRDAKEAKKATLDFSHYLRGNLDSLTLEQTVPFEQELEHLKIYLTLEKKRFEEKLHIVYDISAKDFEIPALTVQPLAENAVKYGVGKKEEGGTVTIYTSENEQFYIIKIIDDGVGFDSDEKTDNGRSHIGIQNVRDRLWMMCEAKLVIESTKGIGTVSTIYIPKKGTEDENNSN